MLRQFWPNTENVTGDHTMIRFFGTLAMAFSFAILGLGQIAAVKEAQARHMAQLECYEASAGGLVASVENCE